MGSKTSLHSLKAPSLPARVYTHIDAKLISGFSPAYYTSVMGTGILCNIMYSFVFPARWLQVCGIIMAVVALILFVVLTACFAAALVKNEGMWSRIHRNRAVAPFVGCGVMGYITLVNMLHLLTNKLWIIAVWVLWWISVFLSVYCSFVTFYYSSVGKHHHLDSEMSHKDLSFTILLPVVTLTVAALLGGLILPDLPSVNLEIITCVVSFLMWAIAVVLAFIVTSVNFWRLFVHRVPDTSQVFTLFLPIGFLGQGAFGIALFGRNCARLLLANHDTVQSLHYTSYLHQTALENGVDMGPLALIMASALLLVCTCFSLILILFGYLCTFIAVVSTLSKVKPFTRKPNLCLYTPRLNSLFWRLFEGLLRFNRGFWSMTFPLGTMALSNGEVWHLYAGLKAFRYVSAIYSVSLFLITIGCLFGVIYKSLAQLRRCVWPSCEDMV